MDEMDYIEREAREDGEREYIERCHAEGRCVYCGGFGRHYNPWGTGDMAAGWADTCEECGGNGRADDSEQENAR